jgi:hypothetical protein
MNNVKTIDYTLNNHLTVKTYSYEGYDYISEYNSYFINDSDIKRIIEKPRLRFYLIYDYFKTDSKDIKRWFEYKNNIMA